MALIGVAVQGAQQLRDLQRRLKAAGRGDLQKELRQGIRKASKPAVADTKAAVLALQVKGTRGGGKAARILSEAARRDRFRGVSVQESARAYDAARKRGGGLRRTTADATRVSVTATGVRIAVNSKRFPADQRGLPRALDLAKGWRHPVFGNRENWVTQRGGPWFYTTLIKHAPNFRKAITEVMEQTARKID